MYLSKHDEVDKCTLISKDTGSGHTWSL